MSTYKPLIETNSIIVLIFYSIYSLTVNALYISGRVNGIGSVLELVIQGCYKI